MILWRNDYIGSQFIRCYVAKHIVYGADPVGVRIGGSIGFGIDVSITFSCLHITLWTNGWSLTKFSWIYNRDITKNWSDLCDIDLIVKVTAVEKRKLYRVGWGDIGFLSKYCY